MIIFCMQNSAPRISRLFRLALLLLFNLILVTEYLSAADHLSRIPVVSVHKGSDGLTLQNESGRLEVEVFSPDVIRVVYAAGDALPANASLAVIGEPASVVWKLTRSKSTVSLLTSEVEARVNRATGAIAFYDKKGNPVLSEPAEGGKSLTPNRVGDLDTLRSQQAFVLPAGEAIYGLGQHQQGEMNYHGASVQLLQENRERSGVLCWFPSADMESFGTIPQ